MTLQGMLGHIQAFWKADQHACCTWGPAHLRIFCSLCRKKIFGRRRIGCASWPAAVTCFVVSQAQFGTHFKTAPVSRLSRRRSTEDVNCICGPAHFSYGDDYGCI
eukprot:668276-Pleurochrysis_carterae.AAC.9